MAVSEADIKLLWGRAAGICSRPGCRSDLTRMEQVQNHYNVGEMAHVIARSAGGPRGDGVGGVDTYDNLILLCPTCHRDVDKAPEGKFPVEALQSWKTEHESYIREIGLGQRLANVDELLGAVSALLAENRSVWAQFGPKSEIAERDPGSNAHKFWELRRIDKIIPNNRRIINLIRTNQALLNRDQNKAFAEFVAHAEGFEHHVYDRLDFYPLFPISFDKEFAV